MPGYINGFIQKQPLLNRGSNKLYSSERKKIEGTVCETLQSSGSLLYMIPILSSKLKTVADRGIPTLSKLELFCQYVRNSWHYIVTKSSGDLRSASGLFVFCAKYCQKDLTKLTFTCSQSKRRATVLDVKLVQS